MDGLIQIQDYGANPADNDIDDRSAIETATKNSRIGDEIYSSAIFEKLLLTKRNGIADSLNTARLTHILLL